METKRIYKNGYLKVILSVDVKGNEFNEIVEEIKNKVDIKILKLDLRNIMYMYSKDIAKLIFLKKICDEKKVELILANVSESILQLLEIADLIGLFRIEEDYSSYNANELIKLFLDPEKADFMTDYLSHHYTGEVKEDIHNAILSDDPLLREYAILTAGKAQDYDAIKEIRNALNDEVAPVVRAAALVVGWLNDEDSKDFLYDLLESEFLDIIEAAAISISLMATGKDATIIGRLLKSNDENKRRIAVNALGLINDDISYNLLMEQYERETNLFIKALIVRTLSFFRRDNLIDFFVKELENSAIEIQEAATSAIVRLKATDKVENLLKKLNAENSWVSFFSVKALGELGCCLDIIYKLENIYNDSQLHVKIAIVEAIGKICNRLTDIDKSDIFNFMKNLLNEKNEDIRKEVLSVLSYLSKEDCVKVAVNLLNSDGSWIVRLKSVEVLCDLKPRGYKKILEEHLNSENNRYVIEKIQEAL